MATLHIDAKTAAGCRTFLMGMKGNVFFIEAYKHGVVVFGILKQKPFSGKLRQHLTADATLLNKIGKHPAHIRVRWRQNKGFSLFRFAAFAVLPVFHTLFTAQQQDDRLRERQVIEPFDEINGIAALLSGVIIPAVASNRDAVVTGQPLIPAGGQELFY